MDKQWKVVPVEPTPEMMEAADDRVGRHQHEETRAAYAAMLAAAPQPPSASDERERFEAWAAPLHVCLLRDRMDADRYRLTVPQNMWEAWQARAALAPSPGVDAAEQKPVAWLVPSIHTFAGAQWTSCPPDMQAEFEGVVKWSPSIIGDMPPVVDKFGVTHRPRPLYAAPSPAASADEWMAEAVRLLADYVQSIGKRCSTIGTAKNRQASADADVALLAHLKARP